MPYAKDWKRYEPMMQLIVEGWKKKLQAPMEAHYDSATRAHGFRLKFYAFIRALERAKTNDPKAKELWDTARQMQFRLEGMQGEKVNFVKGYVGPVKLTICEAGHLKYGDAFSEFAQQNGMLATPEEINDPARMERLLAFQEQVNKERAEGKDQLYQPPELPMMSVPLKRQPVPPTVTQLHPQEPTRESALRPPQPETETWKGSPFTKAELIEQAKQVFSPKMLGTVMAKDPVAAERIARKQLLAFAPDGVSSFSPDANEKICKDTFDWLVGNGWAVE